MWMIWAALVLTILLIVFLATNRRYRIIYLLAKTFRRDLRGVRLLFGLKMCVRNCTRNNLTVAKMFSSIAKDNSQKVAFYFEEEVWSFKKVDEFSNQVANYFLMQGYQKGDRIALLLEGSAEYPCIWIGLSKIGVITALINTNLVKDSLIHSITSTECRSLIFGSNFEETIKEISSNTPWLKMFQLHEKYAKTPTMEGCVDLRSELNNSSPRFSLEKAPECAYSDPAIYIFTSGTTGLPKAARLTHLRCILMARAAKGLARVRFDDIFYTPLPLYHTAGGLMGVGQALFFGTTVAIRKKFSATQYFNDCIKYNATVAHYVGELCRYLLAVPQNGPIKHKVRTMLGNGLRPQLWKPLVERYKIKNVVEIYGATEGISNLGNLDNKVGAIGFVPIYLRKVYPAILIKCDEETGEPVRDPNGRCIKCGPEEPGILIGKIDPNMPVFKYDGYTDKRSSENKILSNVFTEGDMYFNSGDILVCDELGYFYFRDRTGDTFRWKGENVSTSEIEGVIGNIVQLNDVVVYGVTIPENEGRAGMAAVVDPKRSLDLDLILNDFKNNLPSYAIPVFIRISDSLPLTGTFKVRKTELRAEGYNIEIVKDSIYFLHPKHKKYILLTKDIYEELLSGKIRL